MLRIVLLSLVLICSTNLFAQKDKAKIEGAIVGFFNGLSLINADTLKHYSTADFQLLEDGEIWNLDTLIHRVEPMKNSGVERINKFEFIRTHQSGDMAWVSYHNSAEFRRGDKQRSVRWLESAVLVKNKGRWRIQMMHSTKLE
jgi:hypothetical protein